MTRAAREALAGVVLTAAAAALIVSGALVDVAAAVSR